MSFTDVNEGNNMRTFAKCRKRAGLTQIRAAELLQVDKSTVAKWESENHIPRIEMLRKIAKLYGCSIAVLLGEDEHDAE